MTSVLRQKSLYFDCHSGLDPESSVFTLDSRFRGNDGFGTYVKKRWTHYTRMSELVSESILKFELEPQNLFSMTFIKSVIIWL
jgi:hypothetical protein